MEQPSDASSAAIIAQQSTSVQYTNQELLALRPAQTPLLSKEDDISSTVEPLDLGKARTEVEDDEKDTFKSENVQKVIELLQPTPATTSEELDESEKEVEEVEGAKELVEVKDEHRDEEPEKKKKKKKKKKSSGKNRKPPITGFEEGYCDMPITPAEYNDEIHDIYSPSRTFVERIEQCIQRYRARRKLDEKRGNVFSKFLNLGGVETGVKAFGGGLDKDLIADSTAAELAAITATDFIYPGMGKTRYYDPTDSENWVVDFESIVKGFLSHKAPRLFGVDTEKTIQFYCRIIHNFIQYVRAHDVCPEYEDNLRAARGICALAEEELWAIKQVSTLMPGDFNKATSTLYGGYYRGLPTDDIARTSEDAMEMPRGMSKKDADRIFKVGVAICCTHEQYYAMTNCKEKPRVVNASLRSFEIVDIVMAEESTKYLYSGTKDASGEVGTLNPLGLLRVKHWANPEASDEDMTEEEEAALAKEDASGRPIEEFWLEDDVLDKCFNGMKFECTVRELDIGVKYFDSIMGIYCSFFTYLPNEMMNDWKLPRPNERPPPMVGDAEAEDQVDDDGLE